MKQKLDLPLLATQKATELYESLADKGFENDGTQALIKLWWTDGKQPTNKIKEQQKSKMTKNHAS